LKTPRREVGILARGALQSFVRDTQPLFLIV